MHATRATAAAPARRTELRNGALQADLCIIGAGSGGLSVAAGAVQTGASVILIEKHLMGGDCLNTGCVPSKALLAAAHAAKEVRGSGRFGVNGHEPTIDFAKVQAHVHRVIAAIAPHDSVDRFEGLGEVPYLTNETIVGLTERPGHLLVLGGGPIGMEMAQAFRRLGAAVTQVERAAILPKDEPEAVAVLRAALLREGIALHEGVEVFAARRAANGVELGLRGPDGPVVLQGTHLLVAAGRQPKIEGLGLKAAGIEAAPRGIAVDAGLRSTNRRVFAIGDVAGGPQFTHIAGYHAGIVIRNALFGLPAKVDYAALPWVTYADPELAHVGLTETAAREAGHDVSTLMQPLSGNDRAQAEGKTEGLAKVVRGRRGRILGANALDRMGPRARALGEGIRRNAASYLLVLRLVPLFPFFLVNLVPALVGVRLSTYVATTAFGILPGPAVFSLAGAGMDEVLARGGAFDVGSVLTTEILAALIGLALLSLAAIPLKARFAKA
jgi:pyruvate/2-oxoglutarate dehydrogenase complex dihydrolipoamide dehydrogenase (E3) component